jgi:hypothetical protein
MERQIDSAVKRGRAYWFVDGFAEIGAGIFLLLLGIATLLRGFAAPGGILPWLAGTALDIGILKAVLLLAFVLGLWWLKDRFTYPRTGYARGGFPFRVIFAAVRTIFLAIALPLLLLIGVLLTVPETRSILASIPAWLPLGIGILLGAICYAAGEYMGLLRFRLMGLFLLLAGIGTAGWQIALGFPPAPADWAAPPESVLAEIIARTFTAVGVLVLAGGAAAFLSGLTALVRYRRKNPRPYREEI